MRIYRTLLLIFVLLLLLSANNALCQVNDETTETVLRIEELLIQGENQQAWQIIEEIPEDKFAPDDRFWIMASVQYEMGRVADKEGMPFFQKAEEYARSAIKENADNAEGYKWLAITLGAQAKHSDTKAQVKISNKVKENIERAIALNPDDDISYLVLSRWHYKNSSLGGVARAFAKVIYGGLPKASLDEAEKLLLHAIKLRDRIAHRYYLAKVYDRMERRDDVKAQLERAILLPVTFPEETKEKRKAEKKLQRWK
ncbi:MAG: hypothetical protein DRH08_05330 [Deltaproteobacteria bacterium]|nr:MAG: hypothetical protein DRH08_05330 [Deltaproteobacteria bacterium]